MDIVIDCPLGSTCEEIRDNTMHRCGWYTQMAGQTPDGEQINEWRCAMAWMPIMMTENAQQVRGMTAATESFRNETVKGQQQFNNLLGAAVSQSRKRIDG